MRYSIRRLFAVVAVTAALSVSSAAAQAADPPALGDSTDTWIQALGPPNDHSSPNALHFRRCPGSSIDQFILQATDDGRVWLVQRQPCRGQAQSPSQARAEAEPFLPNDVSGGDAFSTASGRPAWQFTSDSYGSLFPPEMFLDCDGALLPSGTFSLSSSSGGWLLAPGTCPG